MHKRNFFGIMSAKMKTAILSLAMLPFAALAWRAVSLDAGVPAYFDGEAVAVAKVSECDYAPSRYAVLVESANTATNEFEVWFCTNSVASPVSCDFVFGMDAGRLFARGRDLRSVVFDDGTIQTNAVTVILGFERKMSGEMLLDAVEVNEVEHGFLTAQFSAAHPERWRSLKLVSRDCAATPPTVTVTRRKIGTSIHLAAVR